MHEKTLVKKDGGVRVSMSESGEPHADVVFKGVPLELWKQWDNSCAKEYHGIRWLKLWSDHLISQNKIKERDEMVNDVLDKVNFELDQAQQVAQQESNDSDEVAVLSGNA